MTDIMAGGSGDWVGQVDNYQVPETDDDGHGMASR